MAGVLPRAIEDVLAGVDDLLFAGQRPVHLAVAHAGLVGAGQEVMVRHIEEDPLGAAPFVKIADLAPLVPA